MEIYYPQSVFPQAPAIDPNPTTTSMAETAMDVDDMDIDLSSFDAEEIIHHELPQTTLTTTQTSGGGLAPTQIPSADSESATPHKIYIRGLDNLTTSNVEGFSAEHFPSHPPTRIEWIDDTSANIVFNTPATALKAIESFSLHPENHDFSSSTSLLELRTAKALSTHPNSSLQIRTALFTDRKPPRAYEASRFYLIHPEHDPREQNRQSRTKLDRDDGYRKRRYGDQEYRLRKRKDKDDGFDASMYDDNGPSSRRDSIASSPGKDANDRIRRRGDSYRPRRDTNGILRDRSASPASRHSDPVRRRNRTSPPPHRSRDPAPAPPENKRKELFPSKTVQHSAVGKDLVSNKMLAADLKKELFPHKVNTAHHRRSDAFDAADETADLFANGLSVPFAKNSKRASKNLASDSSYGRLKSLEPVPHVEPEHAENGTSIRGASIQDQGFSIRGGATEAPRFGTIKELFPAKAVGNAGKELFAERLHGRGGKRNRAEDMFY